jgi:hypothetical protein
MNMRRSRGTVQDFAYIPYKKVKLKLCQCFNTNSWSRPCYSFDRSLQRPRINPRPVRMGFVWDEVTLGLGFMLVLWCSPVRSIPLVRHLYSSISDRVYRALHKVWQISGCYCIIMCLVFNKHVVASILIHICGCQFSLILRWLLFKMVSALCVNNSACLKGELWGTGVCQRRK